MYENRDLFVACPRCRSSSKRVEVFDETNPGKPDESLRWHTFDCQVCDNRFVMSDTDLKYYLPQ